MPKIESILINLRTLILNTKAPLIILICCGLFFFSQGADPDLFARLAVGRLIEQLGFVPLEDPFAFSPRKPIWVDHEWLSGLVFYKIHVYFSDYGLFMFKVLICALTIWILLRAAGNYRNDKTFGTFLLSLFLLVDSNYVWSSTVRSQVFTYLFLSIYLFIFSISLKSSRRFPLLFMPFIMILWCNTHGGFVVGLGLHLIFVLLNAKSDFKFQFFIFALSLAATTVNPYGFIEYWSYIYEAVTLNRAAIPEWYPLSLDLKSVIPLFVFGSAVTALYKRKREPFIYAFFLVSAYFAYSHQRHLAIFYFITLVFVSDSFDWQFMKGQSFIEKLKLSFCLAVTGLSLYLACLLSGLLIKFNNFTLSYSNYPVEILDWLKRHEKGGKLLIDFNNGSYALWKLYPEFLISLDGRYEELYPDSTMKLVHDALNCGSPEHAAAIKNLEPDYILADYGSKCFEQYPLLYGDQRYKLYRNYKS